MSCIPYVPPAVALISGKLGVTSNFRIRHRFNILTSCIRAPVILTGRDNRNEPEADNKREDLVEFHV